jgi:hypothetical protein
LILGTSRIPAGKAHELRFQLDLGTLLRQIGASA